MVLSPTYAGDPTATHAAFTCGDRLVRPPVGPARTLARLADGAVANLTDSECLDIATMGIEIGRAQVTDADRVRIRNDAVAGGMTPAEANIIATAAMGGWRAVEPVRVTGWLKPSKGF